jgi:hypothetical protein
MCLCSGSVSQFLVSQGSGRFWKTARETLCLVLRRPDAVRSLLDMLSTGIARDRGIPVDHLDDPSVLQDVLTSVINSAIGPKVEMRRWWTFHDATTNLDRNWHSLLLAIMVEYYLCGQDPFDILRQPDALLDTTSNDPTVDNFKFRERVLRLLANSQNQNIMRSLYLVFKTSKHHHATFVQHSHKQWLSLQYALFLHDDRAWLRRVILPSLHESLLSHSNLRYVGLHDSVDAFAPGLGEPPADAIEEQVPALLRHSSVAHQMPNYIQHHLIVSFTVHPPLTYPLAWFLLPPLFTPLHFASFAGCSTNIVCTSGYCKCPVLPG